MSTTEQTQVTVPTGTWQADVVHSSVGFSVPYLGIATFTGEVHDFDATLADGRLTGTARIASVQTKDENLQAHLLAPDFFDAERFPEVSFTADEIAVDGVNVVAEGEVTIKGVTRPATLHGTISELRTDPYGRQRLGLELETVIDRTEFGINWNAPMPDGSQALAHEVTLTAKLSLVAAA